jgi:PKHD-type hydroxylase
MSRLSFNLNRASRHTYSYVYWDGLFNQADLSDIQSYCDSLDLTRGLVKDNQQDLSLRKSDIALVSYSPSNEWLFQKLRGVAEFLNDEFYKFDLTGFDKFQYTVYQETGSEYVFHTDIAFGDMLPPTSHLTRKLSFSLILSDPGDYTGGEFEFYTVNNQPEAVTQTKGRVLAFPSWMLHRIAPITSGARKSLVFWVEGPRFK